MWATYSIETYTTRHEVRFSQTLDIYECQEQLINNENPNEEAFRRAVILIE
jgi:hypothetical protein